jgi:hypothetical protein
METIRNSLNNEEVPKLDHRLLDELNFWRINTKGLIEFPNNLESHGDNTIAFGLALVASEKIKYAPVNHQHDPWMRDLFDSNNNEPQYTFDARY